MSPFGSPYERFRSGVVAFYAYALATKSTMPSKGMTSSTSQLPHDRSSMYTAPISTVSNSTAITGFTSKRYIITYAVSESPARYSGSSKATQGSLGTQSRGKGHGSVCP
ncbi:hypothetical protein EVAR_61293_1 [Eumeta japonica]|uniref:Uncharacterized protein n=1 Tax=Eumeta variegata TaxID=151549 RepID=A0A4C1XK64_EUMVA|nr:hypothetical protein EVAR_61293_1 [Eumeta japonica]